MLRADGIKLRALLLSSSAGGHLLHHGQHQLAIAFIETGGVAANLAQEADFIVAQLGHSPGTVGVAGVGKKLRQWKLHGASNLGESVQGGNRVPVLHAREVTSK